MKIIKKIGLILLILLGFLIMIITETSIRITEGFDSNSINIFLNYISEFSGMNGTKEILGSEAGIMFLFYKIKEHSHWIITGCLVWIILMFYFLMKGRNFNEKNDK